MENCGTVPDLSLWKKKKNEGMGREKKTYGLVGSFSLEGEGFVSVELVKVLVRFEKVSEGCWHICLCSAGVDRFWILFYGRSRFSFEIFI